MMDAFSFIKTDLAENCDFRRNFRVQTYSQIDTAVYPVYTYSVLS